jgi:hypothetical protein
VQPTHRQRPRFRNPQKPTLSNLLVRFGFEPEDLEDPRIAEMLKYKRGLDAAIAEINGGQYSAKRTADLARKFGFHTSDLSQTNIALALKATIDSEIFIDALRRAVNQ